MDTIVFKDQPSSKCPEKTMGEAIYLKILPDDGACSGSRMPPGGPYLSESIQQLFGDWVAGGMQD